VPSGENLTWSCLTHLALALLRDDPAMLAAVRNAMATACTVTAASEDGIQADGSFHQHGPQLYNGGYGAAFAADVARYALITRDTDYALPPAALATFAGYLVNGIAWSMTGSQFDVSVVGRYVARPTTSAHDGVAALIQSAQFESPQRETIRAAAAQTLRTWTAVLPPELAGAATRVEQTGVSVPAMPTGHEHYYTSDYTVHRNASWFASVKMFSTRTKSGEKTNDENLLGSRQSDGRFHLALDGEEYFGGDVFPSLDWSRLPGITVEKSPAAAGASYGFGTRAFAGGTGDGRGGVSAMDVAPLGSSLTARKSWFFFDDAIVFLTSGITATSPYRVETIVNQWPLRSPSAPLISEGNWNVGDGIGYWFPAGGDLHIERAARTGTWAALGGSSDATPHTTTFLTLWLDHGASPASATAAYAIVPRTTPETMRQWAASQPLTILANDSRASAVRDNRNGSLGITFWVAGLAVEGVSSSIPSVVWLTRQGSALHLSAADPTNLAGTFTITLPGAYSGAGATTDGRSTTVTLSRNGGRTTTVILTPSRSRVRVVRR
jgi:hypothetical protein